jgi:hypothetical protein
MEEAEKLTIRGISKKLTQTREFFIQKALQTWVLQPDGVQEPAYPSPEPGMRISGFGLRRDRLADICSQSGLRQQSGVAI